jgi:hypothetical protein
MGDPRRKTLSYHRAEYFCKHPAIINLEICIREAADKLRTVSQRSIMRTGGYTMQLAHYRREDTWRGSFLHLTFETPGEHASIVPRVAESTSELQATTLPSPNDPEFMDGDAFLYVNNNDSVFARRQSPSPQLDTPCMRSLTSPIFAQTRCSSIL